MRSWKPHARPAYACATPGTSLRARSRPGDFATVMQNLLVNAHRHAPGATVSIAVSASRYRVAVAVSDDGEGVPAGSEEAIFERGRRRPGSPGVGLGLYASRNLIRERGGDLALLPSGPGEGARFVVSVPIAEMGSAGDAALPGPRRPR